MVNLTPKDRIMFSEYKKLFECCSVSKVHPCCIHIIIIILAKTVQIEPSKTEAGLVISM